MAASYGARDRLEITSVVSRVVQLLSDNIGPLLILGALIFVTNLLVGGMVGTPVPGQRPTLLAASSIFLLFGALASVFWQICLTRVMLLPAQQKGGAVGHAFGTGVRLYFPVLLTVIWTAICVGFGFVLLIVPGIMLALRWAVCIPVQIAEGGGTFSALSRSTSLTSGSRWQIFGFVLLYLVFVILFMGVGIGLLAALFHSVSAIVFPLNAIIKSLVSVVGSASYAAVYLELRRIKDGVDVHTIGAVFD